MLAREPSTAPRRPLRVEIDGLHFPEGPRWHDGALWISDIIGRRVLRHEPGGGTTEVAAFTDRPSGLGWLPNGQLLVVAMESRQLLRLGGTGDPVQHADLSDLARGMTNDMVVADDGTAFVSDGGFAGFEGGQRLVGQILRVGPDGDAHVAADDLQAPNGLILTPDHRQLIVAESHSSRLTVFDLGRDGSLSGRRTFAELPPASPERPVAPPDGICLDAEGAVWATDLVGRRLLRVRDGGEVAEAIVLEHLTPVACVLGGPERRTLFVCASTAVDSSILHTEAVNQVLATEVEIPGAGRP
jgi:sugar lactone lactonase YvrE